MTNSNNIDRLDRIETLLEGFIAASVADRQASSEDRQASIERLTRIEQLVESNSRSIQALNDDLAEFRLIMAEDYEQARQEREELRRATIGIANLRASLDSDRPTILRKLNSIENKVDRILEQGNGRQQE